MSCITEILRLKGDKKVLLPLDEDNKPWIAVEGGGVYKNYEYLIVLNKLGFRCGYVALPPEHPGNNVGTRKNTVTKKNTLDYFELDIDCHGGLTFSGNDHGLKELLSTPCNDNWIGFDCGHVWDQCDLKKFIEYFGEEMAKGKSSFFEAINSYEMSSVREYPYVESECHRIIDQLIAQMESK